MDTLAVVPIVFNAGAAVLPAVLAGLVSVVAIVFRPKQWGPAIRQYPSAFGGGAALLLLLIGAWWLRPTDAPLATTIRRGSPQAGSVAGATDWTAIGLAYLRERDAGSAVIAPSDPRSTANESPTIFRGNPLRNGHDGGPSPVGLVPAWSYTDPEDDTALYLSSVAVRWPYVYATSATLVPPNSSGSVLCLDALTGTRRWLTYEATPPGGDEAATFKGFFSSPAITADGKFLVVGQGLHQDRDSALLCFDAATGALRWQVPTKLHIESSPAIEGDIVVVGAGAVEIGDDHKPAPGDDPGFVMGVRISDGKLLWKVAVNDPESSPAIADGIAYIGSGVNGNEVVAIRIADYDAEADKARLPRVAWRTKTPYPAIGAVTVAGDLVLIGTGRGDFAYGDPNPAGVVLALDKATGTVRWQADMPDAVLGPVAVQGTRAIVPVRNGEVVAIDLDAKGKILWRQRITDTAPVLAGTAFTGTHVYAVSSDGTLAVLDATDGKIIERHPINRPGKPGELSFSISAPMISNGLVIVGSETGGIQAFGTKAGVAGGRQ